MFEIKREIRSWALYELEKENLLNRIICQEFCWLLLTLGRTDRLERELSILAREMFDCREGVVDSQQLLDVFICLLQTAGTA